MRFIILLFFLSLFSSCNAPSPQQGSELRAIGNLETAASHEECPQSQRAWALAGKEWQEICYENAIPFEAQRWASDGKNVVAIENARCLPEPEPVDLWLLEDSQWSHRPLQGVNSNVLGAGGGLALFDEKVFAIGGEDNTEMWNSSLLVFDKSGSLVNQKGLGSLVFFGLTFLVDDQLFLASQTSSDIDEGGRLDIRDSPGTKITKLHFCFPIGRYGSVEEKSPFYQKDCNQLNFRINYDRSKQPYASRLHLSSVYSPTRDQLIMLSGLEQSGNSTVLSDEDLFWSFKPSAFTIDRRGKAEELDVPPAVGDGVSLLWDAARSQTLLLDPYGDRSYYLQADGSWKEFEHEPLPRTIPEEFKERVSYRVGYLTYRMSHWIAPYFAYWDLQRQQVVVIPYKKPDSLCLPVKENPEFFACPKGHP